MAALLPCHSLTSIYSLCYPEHILGGVGHIRLQMADEQVFWTWRGKVASVKTGVHPELTEEEGRGRRVALSEGVGCLSTRCAGLEGGGGGGDCFCGCGLAAGP